MCRCGGVAYQVGNGVGELLQLLLEVKVRVCELLHHLFRPEGNVNLLLEVVNHRLGLLWGV